MSMILCLSIIAVAAIAGVLCLREVLHINRSLDAAVSENAAMRNRTEAHQASSTDGPLAL